MLRRNFFSAPSNTIVNTTGRKAVSLLNTSSPSSLTYQALVLTSAMRSASSASSSSASTSSLLKKFSCGSASFSSCNVAASYPSNSFSPKMFNARRFNAEQQQQQKTAAEGENKQQQGSEQKEEGKSEEKKQEKAAGEEENKGPGGIRGHIEGIKTDIKQFPDIYNWQNMFSLALFTIFCLSSTGTQVENNWWLDHWGIDADSYKRPWSILFHSMHTNNFLAMIFGILVMHNSLHPLTHGLAGGSAALMQYCVIVSLVSGVLMWGFNYGFYNSGDGAVDVATGRPMKGEKQFGPWDVASAVLLMQYLRMGIAPHRFFLSFNGWVKYACCVGAVCILYYDPQPVVCGTVLGYLLCRFDPRFAAIAAKV